MTRTSVTLAGLALVTILAVGAGARPPAEEGRFELAAGPGRELVALQCAVCHSLKIVVDTRMSRQEWDDTLTWMQDKHHLWELGSEDRSLILDYLETAQGPVEDAETPEEPGPWAQPLYPLNPL